MPTALKIVLLQKRTSSLKKSAALRETAGFAKDNPPELEMKTTKRTLEQQYWIPVATSEEKGQKCLVLSNSSSWWNKLSGKGLLATECLSIPQISVLSHENSEAPEEIKIETRKGETVCLSSEELLSILFCLQFCGVIDEPKVKAPRRSSYWRDVFRFFPHLKISLLRQQFAYLSFSN